MEAQIFGTKKSAATRAALRFFAERRIRTHFVDFAVRGPSRGELQRYVQKFGVEALIDRESKRFKQLGWGAARYSLETWVEKLVLEPDTLRIPLVRFGNRLSIGDAAVDWKGWLADS